MKASKMKTRFRQAQPNDFIDGAIVYIEGDDGDLHKKVIDEVLRPDDTFEAFCADDGCRYGNGGCYVKETDIPSTVRYMRYDFPPSRQGCIPNDIMTDLFHEMERHVPESQLKNVEWRYVNGEKKWGKKSYIKWEIYPEGE